MFPSSSSSSSCIFLSPSPRFRDFPFLSATPDSISPTFDFLSFSSPGAVQPLTNSQLDRCTFTSCEKATVTERLVTVPLELQSRITHSASLIDCETRQTNRLARHKKRHSYRYAAFGSRKTLFPRCRPGTSCSYILSLGDCLFLRTLPTPAVRNRPFVTDGNNQQAVISASTAF